MKISSILIAFIIACTFSCTGNKGKNDHGHEHNESTHEHPLGDHAHEDGETHSHAPAEQEEFILHDSAQHDTEHLHNHGSAHDH